MGLGHEDEDLAPERRALSSDLHLPRPLSSQRLEPAFTGTAQSKASSSQSTIGEIAQEASRSKKKTASTKLSSIEKKGQELRELYQTLKEKQFTCKQQEIADRIKPVSDCLVRKHTTGKSWDPKVTNLETLISNTIFKPDNEKPRFSIADYQKVQEIACTIKEGGLKGNCFIRTLNEGEYVGKGGQARAKYLTISGERLKLKGIDCENNGQISNTTQVKIDKRGTKLFVVNIPGAGEEAAEDPVLVLPDDSHVKDRHMETYTPTGKHIGTMYQDTGRLIPSTKHMPTRDFKPK